MMISDHGIGAEHFRITSRKDKVLTLMLRRMGIPPEDHTNIVEASILIVATFIRNESFVFAASTDTAAGV